MATAAAYADADTGPVALPTGPGVTSAKPIAISAIKRAAAARIKYRYHPTGARMAIPPMQVGFHPLNRNGVGINGSRCDELLSKVIGAFDYGDACHNAVAIEAIIDGQVQAIIDQAALLRVIISVTAILNFKA